MQMHPKWKDGVQVEAGKAFGGRIGARRPSQEHAPLSAAVQKAGRAASADPPSVSARQNPASPTAGAPSKPQGTRKYVVYDEVNDPEEPILDTLAGEYWQIGSNHSRPAYQKNVTSDGEQIQCEVFLYFWDSRDGPSFQGWWFGKSIGGDEVWALCNNTSLTPPASGWHVPYNEEERPSFVVKKVNVEEAGATTSAPKRAVPASGPRPAASANPMVQPKAATASASKGSGKDSKGKGKGTTIRASSLPPNGKGTTRPGGQQDADQPPAKRQAISSTTSRPAAAKVDHPPVKNVEDLRMQVDKVEEAVLFAASKCDESNDDPDSEEIWENFLEATFSAQELLKASTKAVSQLFSATVSAPKAVQQEQRKILTVLRQRLSKFTTALGPLLKLANTDGWEPTAKNTTDSKSSAAAQGKEPEVRPVAKSRATLKKSTPTIVTTTVEQKAASRPGSGSAGKVPGAGGALLRPTGSKAPATAVTSKAQKPGVAQTAAKTPAQPAQNEEEDWRAWENDDAPAGTTEEDWTDTWDDGAWEAEEEGGKSAQGQKGQPASMGSSNASLDKVRDEVSTIEIAVEEATEYIEVFKKEPSEEAMAEAEKAIKDAQTPVARLLLQVVPAIQSAQGKAKLGFIDCRTKLQSAKRQLGELSASLKGHQEQKQYAELLAEVEKLATDAKKHVEEAQKAVDTDDGFEGLPKAEAAAKTAGEAIANTRKIIAKKKNAVHYLKVSKQGMAEANNRLQAWVKICDQLSKQMHEVRQKLKARKEETSKKEPWQRVEALEAFLVALNDASECLAQPGVNISMLGAKEAVAACRKHKEEHLKILKVAQQLIMSRTIEAKKSGDAEEHEEMKTLQDRFRAVQLAIVKWKAPELVVGRISEQLSKVEEVVSTIETAEGEVQTALEAIGKLPEDIENEQVTKEVEHATKLSEAARTALQAAAQSLEGRSRGLPEEKVDELQDRILATQDKLQTGSAKFQKVADFRLATKAIADVEEQVKISEQKAEAVANLSRKLLDAGGLEELEDSKKEELREAVRALLKANEDARVSFENASSSIGRLSDEVRATLEEDLQTLEELLTTTTGEANEHHAKVAEKMFDASLKSLASRLKAAESLTKLASTVHSEIAQGKAFESDELKDMLAKGADNHEKAEAGLGDIAKLVGNHLEELVGESPLQLRLLEMGAKVDELEADLEKSKSTFVDHTSFVSKNLIKVATSKVDRLEADMKKTTSIANPFVGVTGASELAGPTFLARASRAIMKYAESKSLSVEEAVGEICDEGETFSEARFISFVSALPTVADEGAKMTEANLKLALKTLGGKGAGDKYNSSTLLPHLKRRFIVISEDGAELMAGREGPSTLRNLAIGEEVVLLEPEPVGFTVARVKARTVEDQTEGFVALGRSNGEVVLEPYLPVLAALGKSERGCKAIADSIKATAGFLIEKQAELKNERGSGTMSKVEQELGALRARVNKAQANFVYTKRKVAEARQDHNKRAEESRKKRLEVAGREAALLVLQELKESSEAVEEELAEVLASAKEAIGAVGDLDSQQQRLDALESLRPVADQLEALRAKLAQQIASLKVKRQDPGMSQVGSYISKFSSFETKCRAQADLLEDKRKTILGDSGRRVIQAIRERVKKSEMDVGSVARDLATSSDRDGKISRASVEAWMKSSPGSLEDAELTLGLAALPAEMSAAEFSSYIQEFLKCVKDSVLTPDFEVKDSRPLRKLEKGEVVEVLTEPAKDPNLGLERFQCRALRDGLQGWATLRGSQGTHFFEPTTKPGE